MGTDHKELELFKKICNKLIKENQKKIKSMIVILIYDEQEF